MLSGFNAFLWMILTIVLAWADYWRDLIISLGIALVLVVVGALLFPHLWRRRDGRWSIARLGVALVLLAVVLAIPFTMSGTLHGFSLTHGARP